MVIEQWFTMVYDKAWFNDMTMVLLHKHSSMTVENLTSHEIKLINFYFLKFNLKQIIFMQLSCVYSVKVSHRLHALNECFKIQVL